MGDFAHGLSKLDFPNLIKHFHAKMLKRTLFKSSRLGKFEGSVCDLIYDYFATNFDSAAYIAIVICLNAHKTNSPYWLHKEVELQSFFSFIAADVCFQVLKIESTQERG